MAVRLRGSGPLTPAYARRIDRAESQGFSRSQGRSHARPHERKISEVKEEAKRKGISLQEVPIVRDVINLVRKQIKDTSYVEIYGTPTRNDIMNIVEQQREKGMTKARVIRSDISGKKSDHWVWLDSFDQYMESDNDYGYEAAGSIFAIAFV